MYPLVKFSPYSTLIEVRKESHRILNPRVLNRIAKSPIFSTLSFAAIFFFIYADSLISNLSVYPAEIRLREIFEAQSPYEIFEAEQTSNKILEAPQTPKSKIQVKSTSNTMPIPTTHATIEENRPLLTTQEKIEEKGRSLITTQEKFEQNSRPLFTKPEKVEQNSRPLFTKPEEVEGSSRPLLTMQATNEEENETPDPLPPPNLTKEERIEWFRGKLPELEILKSTDLSKKFHGRVLEFFNKQCTIQFFMTWFSPAQTFGPREFLGAETLLKAHPQACLMIISRSLDTRRGYGILKPLLDLGFKVLAITPDLSFLLKDTPAEAWLEEIKSGKRDPGSISLSIHLSDLIRLAMLYKYGGVYLDTDFIILKDFTGLRNTVGAQSIDPITRKWNRLNGAVMIFDIGHPILVDFLQEFTTTFNGNKWGHNGPYLISRVIQRVGDKPGYDITVLRPKAFYPIDWIKITKLFKRPGTEEDSKWIEDKMLKLSKESYGLHLWNKVTSPLVIEEGSALERLIKDHCVVCQGTYNP